MCNIKAVQPECGEMESEGAASGISGRKLKDVISLSEHLIELRPQMSFYYPPGFVLASFSLHFPALKRELYRVRMRSRFSTAEHKNV